MIRQGTIFILLIALFSIGKPVSFAQNTNDSVWKVYLNARNPDTIRLKAINDLTKAILDNNPDSAIILATKFLELAKSKGVKKYVGHAYNFLGLAYSNKSNYTKAMEHHLKALKIRESVGDRLPVAASLNNIGNVYIRLTDYDKALEYYTRSYRIKKEIGDKKGIGYSLSNIGNVYYQLSNYKTALEYHQQSLKLREELGNEDAISASLSNIGIVYSELLAFDKALDYQERSFELRKKLGDKVGMSASLLNMAEVFMRQNKFAKAVHYLNRALLIALEVGDLDLQMEIHQSLFVCDKALDKAAAALEHYMQFIAIRDTISNVENSKKVFQKELEYEYEKKEMKSKEQELRRNLEYQAKAKQQRIIIYASILGLIIVSVFSFFMYKRFVEKRKSERELAGKNSLLETQQKEINEKNLALESKNNEITESIEYAKTIQEALLTSKEYLDGLFKDHFVLFKPKDIVSGDFYWAYKSKSNKVFWAVADCTGHGVSGAFMTMIGNSLLNEIIIENEAEDPGFILDKLRDSVIKTLNKDTGKGKFEMLRNGMDIALCVWNKESNQLSFSGANNLLLIVRNGELIEIKGDRQPIGIHKKMTPFTVSNFNLAQGDRIYTFSDGYADQIGGPQEQRFKIDNLKNKLIEIHVLPMERQSKELIATYEDWKCGFDQIDDVAMMGILI